MTIPARLFAICARAAPVAVVFRRGPSKQVQMLLWNLKTDEIQAGQWLSARVYERRADLSPDGRHLIFFAATHKGRPASNWTAISKPPYFTALHFFGCDHAWNGGGLFLTDTQYWVDDFGPGLSGAEAQVACGLQRRRMPPEGHRPIMGEDPALYVPRLQRDGWVLLDQTSGDRCSAQWVFAKEVRPKWRLIKTFTGSLADRSPFGAVYWETHRLEGPLFGQELGDEWADVHNRSVIYAANGCLRRMPVHNQEPADVTQVADLNANTFRRLAAPYAGVQRVKT